MSTVKSLARVILTVIAIAAFMLLFIPVTIYVPVDINGIRVAHAYHGTIGAQLIEMIKVGFGAMFGM